MGDPTIVGASARDRIARRAARELRDGFQVGLGEGLPALVAGWVPAGVAVVRPSGEGAEAPTAPEAPLDLIIVGAGQVSEHGDLAGGPGADKAGGGGRMADMIARAKRVVVIAEHTAEDGSPRLRRECSLPVSGRGVVHRIVTELATIDVTPDGLLLREVAPGVSARDVQEKTEPTLRISLDLSTMTF
ncbi:MAG TPA: CoA-transferase [Polyangiaceae bacterium]|nr:CoA-transferase [Polyangiaceae bacterium]